MLEKLKIKIHKKILSDDESRQIISLLKEENTHTILSKLSGDIIEKYLNIAISSENFFLVSCKFENKIIGYCLFVKTPDKLTATFNSIKFKILMNLIMQFRLFTLLNVFLSLTRLDLFLLSDEEKKNSEKSFNLNLLAVDKIYQSKGIGSYFLSESIKNINKNYFKFNQIICEAPPTEALKFYKKNNFFLIGKKIRFFKNFYILLKKF